MVYQPVISDADSNTLFLLESASIVLLDVPDALYENISVSDLLLEGLLDLGISIRGMYNAIVWLVSNIIAMYGTQQ